MRLSDHSEVSVKDPASTWARLALVDDHVLSILLKEGCRAGPHSLHVSHGQSFSGQLNRHGPHERTLIGPRP